MSKACHLHGLGNGRHGGQGQERILHLNYLKEEWFGWARRAVPRKGQACSISQKCQREWEAITLVIRTLLLTFKNRSFRRGWYWRPHCSYVQGRCVWGNGGSVAHWRCLIVKGRKCNGASENFCFFLRRRKLLFWRLQPSGLLKGRGYIYLKGNN